MSSSTDTPVGSHAIIDAASQLRATLAGVSDASAWSLTVGEQASLVADLARIGAGVDELCLRVLAAADRNDVAATSAGSSTAVWLAHAVTRPVGAAHADVLLAAALDGGFGATRAALAAGVVDVERARVIVRAVQALPEDAVQAEPGLPRRAEAHLLDLAQKQDAKKLQQLARHLLEVLDPDGADARLGRRLEAEETRAARVAFLEVRDNGDGTHGGRFRIGSLHAAMLKKMLEAILNPARHATATGTATGTGHPAAGEQRSDRVSKVSRPEQLGHAFGELLERFPTDRLPTTGGVSATVVVTLDIDALRSGLGTATLDTSDQISGDKFSGRISAGLARRLACEAGVIPAVIRRYVDGRSVVLDMGRERRLHTKHMRIALGLQQGGCTAEGCERPPGWCHSHHDLPWGTDGHTSVANGRLLCPFHHGKAHSSTHDMTRLPDGKVRFNRRT